MTTYALVALATFGSPIHQLPFNFFTPTTSPLFSPCVPASTFNPEPTVAKGNPLISNAAMWQRCSHPDPSLHMHIRGRLYFLHRLFRALVVARRGWVVPKCC
ncbi:hypothetical protein OF83DRAFT_1286027 [Amylostereum chailletii]|nr:hypothetical protein OF83DRAFT_1286027 [Amylostereum chailletii]